MKKPTMWFPNRSDTNQLGKSQKWLEVGNFGFRKKRNSTIRVAKIEALISFAVTAKLICVFVSVSANCRFFNEVARFCYGKNEKIERMAILRRPFVVVHKFKDLLP